jgi:hypothetical protein
VTTNPYGPGSRFQNIVAAIVVPFAIHSVLAVLAASDFGVYAPQRVEWLPIFVAASVAAGLVFLARAIGYYCIVVALIYVPALAWVLPGFGPFVGHLVAGN